MRIPGLRDNKGYLSLIGLVITALLICILIYLTFRIYMPTPYSLKRLGNLTNETDANINIDTSTYRAVEDSTRKTLEEIKNQHLQAIENQTNMNGY